MNVFMRIDPTASLCLALLLVPCAACSDESPAPPPATTSRDAGADALEFCPSAEDKRVHYRDHDPNACANLTLDCTTDQNGFDNACGCGCIDKGDPLCPPVDDPAITWVSRDPSKCKTEPPICPSGETAFSTSCGCGCTKPGS